MVISVISAALSVISSVRDKLGAMQWVSSFVPSCTPALLLKKLQAFKLPSSSALHSLPSLIVPLDTIRYEMSLWPVKVSCPCSVPSQPLTAGQHEELK